MTISVRVWDRGQARPGTLARNESDTMTTRTRTPRLGLLFRRRRKASFFTKAYREGSAAYGIATKAGA